MTENFADRVIATKGVKARNMIPGCTSIPDLEALLARDERVIVRRAASSRINALRKLDSEPEPTEPATEPEQEPDPVEQTKKCPKCGESGTISEMFGTRTTSRTKKNGDVVKTLRVQSYCKRCRNPRKPKE